MLACVAPHLSRWWNLVNVVLLIEWVSSRPSITFVMPKLLTSTLVQAWVSTAAAPLSRLWCRLVMWVRRCVISASVPCWWPEFPCPWSRPCRVPPNCLRPDPSVRGPRTMALLDNAVSLPMFKLTLMSLFPGGDGIGRLVCLMARSVR